MVKFYELNKEPAPGELTHSLAQSLKKGLFIPTEKKFNALENDIINLRQHIELDTEKITMETNEKFSRLEKEFKLLKRMLSVSAILSVISLVGVVTALILLFNWY